MNPASPATVLRGVVLAATAVPLLAVAPLEAQDGFLFDEPRITVSVRGGYNLAAARSDVYEFFTEQLTLERRDFSGAALVGELGVRVAPRLDLGASIGRTWSRSRSESRTHEGTDGLPIAQTTRLDRTSLTAAVKFYPLARGRGIGRNAWIPARVTPFVGVGGGGLYYDLEQSGEFVDFATCDADDVCDIFAGVIASDGWTETVSVMGGVDYWMTTRLGLSAEARYQWGSAPLYSGFIGFDDVDLRGFQSTVGLSVRF